MNSLKTTFAAVAAVSFCAAHATVLTGNMMTDNAFTAYISTSATVAGTEIGSGTNWGTTYALTPTTLDPGQTYYLNIFATNFGAPGAIMGDYSLDSTDHVFSNGTQHQLTKIANWTVSKIGFGVGGIIPTDLGANGTAPWGVRLNIDLNAHFIWTDNGSDTNLYFQTVITPTSVPEPMTLTLLIGGAAVLARRRKSSAK